MLLSTPPLITSGSARALVSALATVKWVCCGEGTDEVYVYHACYTIADDARAVARVIAPRPHANSALAVLTHEVLGALVSALAAVVVVVREVYTLAFAEILTLLVAKASAALTLLGFWTPVPALATVLFIGCGDGAGAVVAVVGYVSHAVADSAVAVALGAGFPLLRANSALAVLALV